MDCLLNACHVESNLALPSLFLRISIGCLIFADVFVAALVDLAAFAAFDITFESESTALLEVLSLLT